MKKILLVLLVLVAAFFAWIELSTLQPNAIEEADVVTVSEGQPLQSGQTIKILSWNLQFFAGNKNNHFFFDNGPDDWPSKEVNQQILEMTAEIIRQENPDILLFQELDEGAARTAHKDQLQQLLDLLSDEYSHHVSTFYWQSQYLPHPAIMGSTGLKQSIVSKFPIDKATRYSLSEINTQSYVIRQFNPKRAILAAELPVVGGQKVQIMNAHLSAFAQGSNTMEIQVSQVKSLLEKVTESGQQAIIGGDFNLLPNQAAYEALNTTRRSYYNPTTELTPLIEKFAAVPSLADIEQNPSQWFTHTPTKGTDKSPNKTIDYIFYTDGVKVANSYVRTAGTIPISDHLPVVGYFTIP